MKSGPVFPEQPAASALRLTMTGANYIFSDRPSHAPDIGTEPGMTTVTASTATEAETTSRTPATTLLVSVELCSEPDIAPPRELFGHHAACQRGAMFPTRSRPDHHVVRREHRSTLASSVVAKQRTFWWIRSGLEHRPTMASSVVTQSRLSRTAGSDLAM